MLIGQAILMKLPPHVLYCLLLYRAWLFQTPYLILKAVLKESPVWVNWVLAEELLHLQVSKIEDSTMLCSMIYLPLSGKVDGGKL